MKGASLILAGISCSVTFVLSVASGGDALTLGIISGLITYTLTRLIDFVAEEIENVPYHKEDDSDLAVFIDSHYER